MSAPSRSAVARLGAGLLVVLGGVLAVGVLFADRIAPPLAERLIASALPWPHADVEIGSVEFRGLRGLTATDIKVTPDARGDALTIDSVRMVYAAADLVRAPRRVALARLAGVRLDAVRTDSGWTWLETRPPDETETNAPEDGPTLVIDRIELLRVGLEARDELGERVLGVEGLSALAGLAIGGSMELRVDSASATVDHPGLTQGSVAVEAGLALAKATWRIDRLRVLDSEGDPLTARGSVGPGEGAALRLDLEVEAARFRLAELHPALSDFVAGETRMNVDASIAGSLGRPEIAALIDFESAGRLDVTSHLEVEDAARFLDATVEVDALDLARISGGRLDVDPVSGTVVAGLDVAVADSLDGAIDIDLRSRAGDRPVHLAGGVTFDRGLGELSLDARVADLTAEANGHVRPIGALPTWDVRVHTRTEAPLPDFIREREPSWVGPWDVVADLQGEGLALDRLEGRVALRFDPTDPAPRTGPIRMDGRLDDGVLSVTSELEIGGGRTTVVGRVGLARPRADWEITRLGIEGIDLGPWIGGADPGVLSATGRARSVPGGGASADFVLDSIDGGRLDGLSGAGSVLVAAGATRVHADLRRDSMTLRAEEIEITGAGLAGADVAFTRLDPRAFSGSLPDGRLSGRLRLESIPGAARDSSLAPWARDTNVQGRLALGESTLGGDPIDGTIALSLVAGVLGFDADLEGDGQSVDLAGSVAAAADPLRLQIDEGRLLGVDLSGWSGGRVPEGIVNATITADLTFADPTLARGKASILFDSTRVGPVVIDAGRVELDLADGRARLTAEGGGVGRVLDLEMAAVADPNGGWLGDGDLRLADPAFAAPDDTLRLDLAFRIPSGQGSPDWRLSAEGRGPLVVLRLDTLAVEVGLSDGVATLGELTALGPGLNIEGNGTLPLDRAGGGSADLTVTGSTEMLGPLLSVAGYPGYHGRASFELRSTGPANGMRHELDLGVGQVRSRGLEIDSAYVEVEARSDSVAWLADLSALVVEGARRPILLAPGSAPFLVGFGASGALDDAGVTGFVARLDWERERPSTVRVTEFGAVLDGEEWSLPAPGTVDWHDGLAFQDLVLQAADGGRVHVRGRLARTGEQDLAVDVARLPLQARVRGAEDALAGTLDMQLRLAGSAEAPRLEADGRLRGYGAAANVLTLDATWTPGGLELRMEDLQPTGGRFLAEGRLPTALHLSDTGLTEADDGAVDLQLRLSAFDLSFLDPLGGPAGVAELQGIVDGEVRVTGATDDPDLHGRIAASRLGARVQQLGIELTAERVVLGLAGRNASLEETEIHSSRGGILRLRGGLEMPELTDGTLSIEAEFDRFAASHTRQIEAKASGTLAVEGRLSGPRVSGEIRLDEATYWLANSGTPAGLEEIELTESDFRELERRFSISAEEGASIGLLDATSLDLVVTAESETWVRRAVEPSLAVEVAGEVRVHKEAGGELLLEGTGRAIPGRSNVEEFGRRFDIVSGTATIDGPISSATLEADATYEPDEEVTITLHVRGDVDGIDITLGSRPELDRADIISYIAIGRVTSDVQELGEVRDDVAGLGADIALSRLTGEVEDLARRSLGLDVVEIRQDGLKGLTLVAGQYTTRRLFLGFQQPVVFDGGADTGFGIDDTELDAEYRVNDWLLANLSGSRSLVRFFLGVRHAY